MDKSNTLWNINLNVPARSMKGILMLFENVAAQQPFDRNTEAFYNPQITKVEVTIEGIPNQHYSQGMRTYLMWDEAKKYFSPGSKRHPDEGTVAKDLALADVNLGAFLTSKYSLWLDLRTSDDDSLHGSGRRIENGHRTKTDPLGPEPKLSDFYVTSSGQRDRKIAFVVLGMAAIWWPTNSLSNSFSKEKKIIMHAVDRPGRHRLSTTYIICLLPHVGGLSGCWNTSIKPDRKLSAIYYGPRGY